MNRLLRFAVLALMLVPLPAQALPVPTAYAVSTCGTLPTPPGPWLVGRDAPLTVDILGNLCTTGGSGGSGGANASVGATGSAVPSSGTYVAGNKAGVLTGVSLDASGNLNVNVTASSGTGSDANIAKIGGVAVATPPAGVAPGTLPVALDPSQVCTKFQWRHITTATDTQLVPQNGAQTIYVCDLEFSAAGPLAESLFLEKSTTGTCGTPTQIDITYYVGTNISKAASNQFYRGINTGPSAQLCVNSNQAQSLDVGVFYAQY